MRDLWHLFRGSVPRLENLTYAFEKFGVPLENQPIPWNADSVLVAAMVAMPQHCSTAKENFQLLMGKELHAPEWQRLCGRGEAAHLQFRLSVPRQTMAAELIWTGRSLGQISLPVLSPGEFTGKLSIKMPTVSVRVGAATVACQTYVTTQCQGLVVSALLQSPTCLLPIHDLGLHVELCREEGGSISRVPLELSSSQPANQALVTVVPPKPRRMGSWQVTWYLGDKPLAAQAIKAISQRQFVRSLYVVATRFVLKSKRGEIKVAQYLPDLKGVEAVGPCFLVASNETGMAGWCKLQIGAQGKGAFKAPPFEAQEVLITDGPVPFVPGTLGVEDLQRLKQFELRCGRELLGKLHLSPVPAASFTQEGGFAPPESFDWTPAAEDQLQERLSKLLE